MLQAVENKAINTAKEIAPFTFEQFEKKLYRKKGEGGNVFYHYKAVQETLLKNGQLGTEKNYYLSLKSFKEYIRSNTGKEPTKLLFTDVTPNWLNGYEKFMIGKNRSLTTVSMYLRTLRTIFNKAIAENDILPDFYPFGKKKYQVPAVKKVKKALSKENLRKLFDAVPQTADQQKAKDFWFFSYFCNGINIKDIALLKHKDLHSDKFVYYRAKTINTAKANLIPVTVYLNEFTKSVIERYGSHSKAPETFVFPILNNDETPEIQFKNVKNFVRYINQHLKKLAVQVGIDADISTYWARHSFATIAVRNGASMELISEALNHSNLKVTQGYFSGFEDKQKLELMESLMIF